MTLDAYFPKKRGRRPKLHLGMGALPLPRGAGATGTVHFRMYMAHQEKLLQVQKEEPLTDFDMAAKIEGLRRRR